MSVIRLDDLDTQDKLFEITCPSCNLIMPRFFSGSRTTCILTLCSECGSHFTTTFSKTPRCRGCDYTIPCLGLPRVRAVRYFD